MQLANRMQTLSESITIAISTKAKEMKAAVIDVISLSAGEPDFMTPKKIRETSWRHLPAMRDTARTPDSEMW